MPKIGQDQSVRKATLRGEAKLPRHVFFLNVLSLSYLDASEVELLASGTIGPAVEAAMANLPEASRQVLRIAITSFSDVERMSPNIQIFQWLFQLSDDQVDQIFEIT